MVYAEPYPIFYKDMHSLFNTKKLPVIFNFVKIGRKGDFLSKMLAVVKT